MPHAPRRPAELSMRVFIGSSAVRHGLLTVHQLRGQAWVRLGRDIYADVRLRRDHGLRCLAAALHLPPSAAFAGRSAAFLLGASFAAGFLDEAHVIVNRGTRLRSRRGLRAQVGDVSSRDVAVVGDLTCTTPLRTAWDVAAGAEPATAVAVIRYLLHRGLISWSELTETFARRADRPGPGTRRATRVLALVTAVPPTSSVRPSSAPPHPPGRAFARTARLNPGDPPATARDTVRRAAA
jgi:hypothetical protein